MFILRNWQQMLDEAGLTQRELAAIVKYGEGTISDLVTKDKGGQRLKRAVLDVLKKRPGSSRSEVYPTPQSEESGVAKFVDRPDNVTLEQWKLRAIQSEEKLAQVQANLRAALSLSEAPSVRRVSSALSVEDQSILDAAEEEHDGRHGKP